MPLMLDDLRNEFALHLADQPQRAASLDDTLRHVLTLAYCAGLEDGTQVGAGKTANAALDAAQPLFWYRLVGSKGLYEGPVHNNSIAGRKQREENPGQWVPLYTKAAP